MSGTVARSETGRLAKRSRRSWSDDDKRRLVVEACQPGASVADVARRHGVNANLLFKWRNMALAGASEAMRRSGSAEGGEAAVKEDPAFIPIGVLGRGDDEGPALIAVPARAAADGSPSSRATSRQPAADERIGMIEIDLADGTRLRVDAFVNARALRRVIAVLKAAS